MNAEQVSLLRNDKSRSSQYLLPSKLFMFSLCIFSYILYLLIRVAIRFGTEAKAKTDKEIPIANPNVAPANRKYVL